ncbi:MAG: DUF4388 domain-containing protein [Actinomycetes bacterium]
MRGSLSETSVADLCRGLADAGSTGTVEIDHPDGNGAIVFRSGRIVVAGSPAPRARLGDRLVNAALLSPEQLEQALADQRSDPARPKLGALLVERGLVTRDAIRVFVQEQILDALFEVFPWTEGTYRFDPTPLIDEEERLPVELTVDQMLVEVSRRHSEWDQIRGVIADLDAVPTFATGGSNATASLEPDEFAVLASVDGSRTVRELAEDLGYSEFEAARIVYGLVLLGVIGIEGQDQAVRPAAPTAAPDHADEPDTDDAPVDSTSAPAEAAPTAPEPADHAAEPIDVAAALEEAIARTQEADGWDELAAPTERPAPGTDAPPARPTVRISSGPGAYPWDEDTASEPSEPQPVDVDDDDWTTAFDQPAPIHQDRPAVTESGADDEPEPWVFDGEPSPLEVDEEVDEEPDETGADDDAPTGIPNDEFGALIDELTEGAPAAVVEPDPAPAEEHEEEPAPRRGGDVSEFLRELSRLALDDGGDVPPPADPDGRPEAPRRRPDPAQERGGQGDDQKKRGLFGWGR